MRKYEKTLDPYWLKLFQIATDLRRTNKGFWRAFVSPQALMSWLHYRGQCAYCCAELIQKEQLVGGASVTDHVLCRARCKIGFSSHFNAAPACASCNSIKIIWDRKLASADVPDEITQEIHDRFVAQARQFIMGRRAKAGATFPSDEADWVKALQKRDALIQKPINIPTATDAPVRRL